MLVIDRLSFGYNSNSYSFSDKIQPATITFLLGANGSGKTSLLKTLSGLLPPISGNIQSESRPLYLPAHPEASDWLSASDIFEIFNPQVSKWAIDQDIEDLGISSIFNRPIHQLSLGEQKRIFLAAVLRSSFDVIFLDEPLNSLDWNMELILYKILERHRTRNRSFLIAAHQLQWVSRFQNSPVWFLHHFARLKSGFLENVLTSTEVRHLFNFDVAFTDNPLDGSRMIATSELKGPYETS